MRHERAIDAIRLSSMVPNIVDLWKPFIEFSPDIWGKILYNPCMTVEKLIPAILDKLSLAPPVGAKVKFDFGDDGFLFLDGTGDKPELGTEDGEAETTLACSVDTFQAILDGTQDPTMAYMTGKLKVQGSMGYALKLNGILGD
jgi:putative sterol carrier protein